MGRIKYLFDGKDVSEYGVSVLSVSGIFDKPKRKIGYRNSWNDISGEQVDLSVPVTEARIIKLECIVSGTSISQAWVLLNGFLNMIDAAGARQFTIEYENVITENTPALSYIVFREDAVNVKKKFRNGKNVWEFSLSLQEYLPCKRIFRFIRGVVPVFNIEIDNITKPFILCSGDGRQFEITGGYEHQIDYEVDGSYVVAIFSNTHSDYTVISTNGRLIWTL